MHPHRYSAPFREQVQSWVVKLSTVSEILELWLMVQVRKWRRGTSLCAVITACLSCRGRLRGVHSLYRLATCTSNATQNMWQYMEAVFSGGDIVKQLPAEAKRFQNIDKNYIKVTQRPPRWRRPNTPQAACSCKPTHCNGGQRCMPGTSLAACFGS